MAIEFVRWLAKDGWEPYDDTTWRRVVNSSNPNFSIETEYKDDTDLYSDYLKEHPVWKDGKPDKEGNYIACFEDDDVDAFWWDGKNWLDGYGEPMRQQNPVWRELPEGPK